MIVPVVKRLPKATLIKYVTDIEASFMLNRVVVYQYLRPGKIMWKPYSMCTDILVFKRNGKEYFVIANGVHCKNNEYPKETWFDIKDLFSVFTMRRLKSKILIDRSRRGGPDLPRAFFISCIQNLVNSAKINYSGIVYSSLDEMVRFLGCSWRRFCPKTLKELDVDEIDVGVRGYMDDHDLLYRGNFFDDDILSSLAIKHKVVKSMSKGIFYIEGKQLLRLLPKAFAKFIRKNMSRDIWQDVKQGNFSGVHPVFHEFLKKFIRQQKRSLSGTGAIMPLCMQNILVTPSVNLVDRMRYELATIVINYSDKRNLDVKSKMASVGDLLLEQGHRADRVKEFKAKKKAYFEQRCISRTGWHSGIQCPYGGAKSSVITCCKDQNIVPTPLFHDKATPSLMWAMSKDEDEHMTKKVKV